MRVFGRLGQDFLKQGEKLGLIDAFGFHGRSG
jgi:hypothetical protein